MNQTRVFLIFAWLLVATLLWVEWGKDHAPAAVGAPAQASGTTALAAIPAAPGSVPTAPSGAAVPPAKVASPRPAATVVASNDVLRLVLDGGTVRSAELLKYPQTTDTGSPPVQLLADSDETRFVAQSGWVATQGSSPTHDAAFEPEGPARTVALAPGADTLEVPFVWTSPEGVRLRRTYILHRGDYTVGVRDEVRNAGTTAWQGFPYRQLLRNPPPGKRGLTNPEAYSFSGAAWYSPEDKYEKRKYGDFEDGPLEKTVTGGWIALLQHYFFAAWVPAAQERETYQLATTHAGNHPEYLVRAVGTAMQVPPGGEASSSARLWLGPKLQDRLDGVAPGLGLTLDYGMFTVLSQPIHWLLAQLHKLTLNWGWAIVLLVVLIKLALYPLSAAQYRSMAKMRRFQPRIEQIKERYGDDRQKVQMAMMELYKKEKINPVGGCLPVLIQMPVFLSLYWVLVESVELRQAIWIPGWIDNLTARDPYFILPVLNVLVMWTTQKLTPAAGMDPTQRKMMQLMPLVMGVMFAFFPAGLVLYWVTNGALGLAQQWWNTRRYADAPAKA